LIDTPGRTTTPIVAGVARRLPFFYGWIIVFLSFLTIFFTGSVTYWGLPVFVGPMHDDTGWSHASILGALAVRSLTGACLGLALGRLMDQRLGPMFMLLCGVLIDGSSLMSLRWVHSPLAFLVVYGGIGGIGSTGTRMVQATLVPKWFVARRGSAVAFSLLGGSISALLMVPVISYFIDAAGWRDAWLYIAIIMMAGLLPMVPFAVRAPEDIGLKPDNGVAPLPGSNRLTADTERSYRLAEALPTARMWVLLLAMMFGSYSLNTQSIVMVPYYKEIGFSSAIAASALSVYGFFSISSRFVWGFTADRFSTRTAIILQALLTGLCAFLILQIAGRSSLYLVSAFLGVMLGGFPTLQSLIWPEFFGRRYLGSILGFTQLFTTIASASGPVIAGFIYDRSGTYATSLWLLVGAWLLCAGFTFLVRPRRQLESVAAVST
jgi:MFS family permease